MEQSLPEHSTELIVILGSGGVGKTTSAAALALRYAETGKKTLVITVDPAKRLAQALGLQSLSNDAQNVATFPNGGTLSALWLDTSSAFESLVRRHGTSVKNAEKILEHRLFKIIKSQLGGVEEYLGLEQVLRLGQSGLYDICVLDTPPSRHALDFLESPQHLLAFFDDSVVKVFMNHSDENSESGGFFKKIFMSGKAKALETFKTFLGKSFLNELAELLENFEPVQKVLRSTAMEMEAWVRSEKTHFILISLLEKYPLDEVRLLTLELEARNLASAELLVLNKCLPIEPPPEREILQELGPVIGASLIRRAQTQDTLRNHLQTEGKPAKSIVEVPQYSVTHLNQRELLEMGRIILKGYEKP